MKTVLISTTLYKPVIFCFRMKTILVLVVGGLIRVPLYVHHSKFILQFPSCGYLFIQPNIQENQPWLRETSPQLPLCPPAATPAPPPVLPPLGPPTVCEEWSMWRWSLVGMGRDRSWNVSLVDDTWDKTGWQNTVKPVLRENSAVKDQLSWTCWTTTYPWQVLHSLSLA